ncbi:hypothetical protein NBRC116583_17360 [Arenicella sp. 4NH20-0111]|uniref:hypothetical protein n=1 Tax=Arenicella sp. 4NH20-0111 TaxID=3127648 RepID=UPI00310A1FB8
MKNVRFIAIASLSMLLVACGSSKKNIALKVHSDPLGAYALMQVKYKGKEDSDWIYLGPTPVVLDKKISFDGASSVSLKMIKSGYHEQVRTWAAKDFLKEYRQQKKISWVPALVKQ